MAPTATVMLTLAGGVSWEQAWRTWHWRWLMGKTPRSRIRSVPMGRVVVVGTVRTAGTGRVAPASDRPAVCWELRSGVFRLPMGWDGAAQAECFWLEDETGRILVDPAGSLLELPEYSTEWDDGSMVHERSVGPGDRIAVLGEVIPNHTVPATAPGDGTSAGLLHLPRHGVMVICPEDVMPATPGTPGTHAYAVLGLGLLLTSAVVAPRGVLAHPLQTLGVPAGIVLGTLVAGAGLVRFIRGLRHAVRSADVPDLLLSTYALVLIMIIWWIGGLAGFMPFPFH